MILGTAGHIDHGKTTLVRALTGIDTDRLPEEKRRGITIELGFAPLTLDGVGTLGVVDVPGHEAFVRTMLAGATGVDIALLVIAADEGPMPQTREHLAILSLLGIAGGVIALTKSDLVDAAWCELVEEEVRTLLLGTPLAAAPVLPPRHDRTRAFEPAQRLVDARRLDAPHRAGERQGDEREIEQAHAGEIPRPAARGRGRGTGGWGAWVRGISRRPASGRPRGASAPG